MESFWIGAIVIWLACGAFSAIVASGKGHNGCSWFIVGFLFGPLGLLATIGLSQTQGGNALSDRDDEERVETPTHEHDWANAQGVDPNTSEQVSFKRCIQCGIIQTRHEHSWAKPLESGKFQGRMFQECQTCDSARYLDDPVANVKRHHDHDWGTPASYGGVKGQQCGSCGLIEQLAHEHNWGDPLPSQKYAGRLYQDCTECGGSRYIN